MEMKVPRFGMSVVLMLAWGTLAQAGPVQFQHVPADAAWLAHVDADAARASAVMEKTYEACVADAGLAKVFEVMEEKCGVDPRTDLHGLTLYGTKIARGHGVMIVRADMDQEKLVERAKKTADYRTIEYGEHEIHTWTKKKGPRERTAAGAFHQSNTLLLASGVGTLKTAIDALDGKGKSLKTGKKPLAAKVPKGTIFLLRAIGIGDSPMAAKRPFCSQLIDFSYAEGEHGDRWSGHIEVTAESEEVAEHAKEALAGFRAVLWMASDPAPKLQKLLDEVDITQDGRVVKADFEASVEKVAAAMPGTCDLIAKHVAKHHKMAKAKYGEKPEKKKAEQVGKEKRAAKPKEPSQGKAAAEKDRGMRKPTARQGTPVLGVVIGKPTDVEAAEVIRVWEDSPAAKAGLKPGDRIMKVDGEEIASPEALRAAVLRHKPGDEIELVLRREGDEKTLRAQLAGGDDFGGWARRGRLRRVLAPRPWLGVQIGSGAGRGVEVFGVVPFGPADRSGLESGDAILRVDKTRVEAPADLQTVIAGYRPGETVRLKIIRDDERQTIEVELGAFGALDGEGQEEARELIRRFLEGRLPEMPREPRPERFER